MDSHAWTDENGWRWAAVKGGALRPLGVSASRVLSKAVGDEILRLAALSEELERKLEFHMRETVEAKARYHGLRADRSEEMLRLATENESLGTTVGGQAQMITSIRQQLRIECGEIGDNSWPDDLHPSDVIEKYLATPAAARIAELELRVRELEGQLSNSEAPPLTYRLP